MARANTLYYARQDPFQDFTTAPEIGQVFGELLGAWAAVVWQQMGAPDPVRLIEAGPGRGTLMIDVLRCVRRVASGFWVAIDLHLIETSPRLRGVQAEAGLPARWHDTLETVPEGPAILLANEFLDALPIRQFVGRAGGWCERHVEGGAFVDLPVPGLVLPHAEGSVVEHSDAATSWVAGLASRLVRSGGAALMLDYGPSVATPGDTLQALRGGRPACPLSEPGSADMTAHVDFTGLSAIALRAGAAVHGPVPQGSFLERLGLGQRTERLAAANPARAGALKQAAARLARPERMGALFKAFCISHPACPCPPGFEEDQV